jgi:hypothetical protein
MSGKDKEVMTLAQFDYFGELSLLTGEPRKTNVIACAPTGAAAAGGNWNNIMSQDVQTKMVTKCLMVGKAAFEEVLGPLKAILEAHRQYKEIPTGEGDVNSTAAMQAAAIAAGGSAKTSGKEVPLKNLSSSITRALKPRNSAHGELWLHKERLEESTIKPVRKAGISKAGISADVTATTGGGGGGKKGKRYSLVQVKYDPEPFEECPLHDMTEIEGAKWPTSDAHIELSHVRLPLPITGNAGGLNTTSFASAKARTRRCSLKFVHRTRATELHQQSAVSNERRLWAGLSQPQPELFVPRLMAWSGNDDGVYLFFTPLTGGMFGSVHDVVFLGNRPEKHTNAVQEKSSIGQQDKQRAAALTTANTAPVSAASMDSLFAGTMSTPASSYASGCHPRESAARFYVGCIVLALDFLHSEGVLVRAIAPELLMLSDKGYLCLCDFRLAKKVGSGRTFTLCGTPEFMSPEQVRTGGPAKYHTLHCC